ncbi:MAG: RNA polymerase sigma factor [Isosphaeraceae bacterium]
MRDTPTTRPSLLVRLRDPMDERAWGEFVEIYGPLIEQLARRRGLQEADAADLVQEVFRAVAVAIERYDPDPAKGSFRGWLSTIARNLIVNLLKAQRRHPRGTGDTEIQQFLEAQPAPDDQESALFDAEYHRRLLHWAAERVKDEFTAVVWLAFWKTGVEAQSADEAARALGLSVGTVYQYKSRVVARLRREIERVSDGE